MTVALGWAARKLPDAIVENLGPYGNVHLGHPNSAQLAEIIIERVEDFDRLGISDDGSACRVSMARMQRGMSNVAGTPLS